MEIINLQVDGQPKTEVKLYSTIDDLLIERYNEFKKLMAMHWVGDPTIPGIQKHLEKLTAFIQTDKKEEAIGELSNLMYGLTMIIGELNPRHVAFGHLIHSINGEKLKDYSEENIEKVLTDLSAKGLNEGQVSNYINSVKKKLILN